MKRSFLIFGSACPLKSEVRVEFYSNLDEYSDSAHLISRAVQELFKSIVDPKLLIRRITISVNNIKREKDLLAEPRQLSLFTKEKPGLKKEKRVAKAILEIKRRYGKNAILKGINYEEGATGRERNAQIGGHKA